MKQEFSLAYLTVFGCPPPEMVYIASMAGYDYVSLRPIMLGIPGEPCYDLAADRELYRKTKKALAYTGMKLLDIELARVLNGVDLENYKPAMEAAAELGGKHVLSSIWTENRSFYLDKFGELCDLAGRFGLTVDLEFVPISGVRDLKSAVDVLRSVNRTNAGLMIDMHHFHRSKDDPEELGALPREWFHFAHLCDAPGEIPSRREEMTRIMREGRLYVGEGGIDVAGIVNRMPEIPYSIELPNLANVKEFGYAEHARRCLRTAREYIARNPRG